MGYNLWGEWEDEGLTDAQLAGIAAVEAGVQPNPYITGSPQTNISDPSTGYEPNYEPYYAPSMDEGLTGAQLAGMEAIRQGQQPNTSIQGSPQTRLTPYYQPNQQFFGSIGGTINSLTNPDLGTKPIYAPYTQKTPSPVMPGKEMDYWHQKQAYERANPLYNGKTIDQWHTQQAQERTGKPVENNFSNTLKDWLGGGKPPVGIGAGYGLGTTGLPMPSAPLTTEVPFGPQQPYSQPLPNAGQWPEQQWSGTTPVNSSTVIKDLVLAATGKGDIDTILNNLNNAVQSGYLSPVDITKPTQIPDPNNPEKTISIVPIVEMAKAEAETGSLTKTLPYMNDKLFKTSVDTIIKEGIPIPIIPNPMLDKIVDNTKDPQMSTYLWDNGYKPPIMIQKDIIDNLKPFDKLVNFGNELEPLLGMVYKDMVNTMNKLADLYANKSVWDKSIKSGMDLNLHTTFDGYDNFGNPIYKPASTPWVFETPATPNTPVQPTVPGNEDSRFIDPAKQALMAGSAKVPIMSAGGGIPPTSTSPITTPPISPLMQRWKDSGSPLTYEAWLKQYGLSETGISQPTPASKRSAIYKPRLRSVTY